MIKIILIDDDYARGWEHIFGFMFKDIYEKYAEFVVCKVFTDEHITEIYKDNPHAIFIQDNQLSDYGRNSMKKTGLDYLRDFGDKRKIIFHSADHDKGFLAAKYGAVMFLRKDDPARQMSNKEMQDQILEMHQIIIRHLGLCPEYIWIPMMKMGLI